VPFGFITSGGKPARLGDPGDPILDCDNSDFTRHTLNNTLDGPNTATHSQFGAHFEVSTAYPGPDGSWKNSENPCLLRNRAGDTDEPTNRLNHHDTPRSRSVLRRSVPVRLLTEPRISPSLRGFNRRASSVASGPIQQALNDVDPYGGPYHQGAYVDVGNLNILADGTGGTVMEAGNALEAGLRSLATSDCVYGLGFVPAEKADGSYHKLKVTLKDSRKLNVHARGGYCATEGAEAPERAASGGPVSFSARTNLVQVPAVVRDKCGSPVGDLHKGDFQLADRGQKQEIIAFSEEKLERPARLRSPLWS